MTSDLLKPPDEMRDQEAMASTVFNVAGIEVAHIESLIGGERWVQLRLLHAGYDSPILVQLPERAWHNVAGCTMVPTEKWPAGECLQCGNMVGPP